MLRDSSSSIYRLLLLSYSEGCGRKHFIFIFARRSAKAGINILAERKHVFHRLRFPKAAEPIGAVPRHRNHSQIWCNRLPFAAQQEGKTQRLFRHMRKRVQLDQR